MGFSVVSMLKKGIATVGFLGIVYLWFSVIILSVSRMKKLEAPGTGISVVISYRDLKSLEKTLTSIKPHRSKFGEVVLAINCQRLSEVQKCTDQWYRIRYCSSYRNENEIINDVIKHTLRSDSNLFMLIPRGFKLEKLDLNKAVLNFLEDENVVAVGGKVTYEGYYLSAGTDFSVSEDLGILFYDLFGGFNSYYRREAKNIQSIMKSGMIMKIDKFVTLGGFDSSLDIVDLCLRIRELGGRIVHSSYIETSPLSIPDYFDLGEDEKRVVTDYVFLRSQESLQDSVKHLKETKSEEFRKRWLKKLQLREYRYSPKLAWDFGGGGCSGWFVEASNFVTYLQKDMRNLRIITGKTDFCSGLPEFVTSSLTRLIDRGFYNIDIFISHKQPQNYPDFQKLGEYKGLVRIPGIPKYVIGRSMYETTRIPSKWIEFINSRVNEVWVPSMFVKQYFEESGVDADKLVYIPETLDPYFYDPDVTPELSENHHIIKQKGSFNFFSVFKWEERKGYKFLIEAYVKEFSRRRDNTTLFILTYHPFYRSPSFAKRKIEMEIQILVDNYLTDKTDIPKIEIICEDIPFPTVDMPSLYKSMDAFVLPTRGEGFGLPIFEAMLMRLPSIVTGFSGHLDFANDETSFLIDVEELEMVDQHFQKALYGFTRHDDNKRFFSAWARPSVSHLRSLMRFVKENQDVAGKTAARGRQYLIENFSPEVVTNQILERLEYINERFLKTS